MNKYSNILFSIICIFLVSNCTQNKIIKKSYKLNYPTNLKIITQANWGGTEPTFALKEHKIDRITLHHGGVEFKEDKDPIEYLRNLQSWSRSEKNWMDIPYHFLIDLEGKIYEGRFLNFPGDTNTKYNPTGHLLICLMGNYEIQKVNELQLESIINLVTYFCGKYNIDPNLIKGHKDYVETACPGKDFYYYLINGIIVNSVKNNLKEKRNSEEK